MNPLLLISLIVGGSLYLIVLFAVCFQIYKLLKNRDYEELEVIREV